MSPKLTNNADSTFLYYAISINGKAMRLIRKYIILLLVSLSILSAEAQSTATSLEKRFQEALNYLKQDSLRDERKAFAIFEELAAKGYEKAQLEVANALINGTGSIAQDCKRGSTMMKILADKGNVDASANYAIMLREGLCVKADTMLALKYDQFAAEHGHLQSMYNLGIALLDGRCGQTPDTLSAIGWFRRAAEKDYAPAQWQLSRHYHNTNNEEEARYWLKRGVENGDPYCIHGIGLAYKNGEDGFPKDEDEALKYFLRNADKYDFLESRIAAARIYNELNKKDAMRRILMPAVQKNEPEAMLMYGESYMDENYNITFEYYKKVSDIPIKQVRKDVHWTLLWAYYRLALCYYFGKGCTQDQHKGAVMLYQMADFGHPMAIEAIKSLNIPRP